MYIYTHMPQCLFLLSLSTPRSRGPPRHVRLGVSTLEYAYSTLYLDIIYISNGNGIQPIFLSLVSPDGLILFCLCPLSLLFVLPPTLLLRLSFSPAPESGARKISTYVRASFLSLSGLGAPSASVLSGRSAAAVLAEKPFFFVCLVFSLPPFFRVPTRQSRTEKRWKYNNIQ